MNMPRRPSLLALLVAVLLGAPLSRKSFAGGLGELLGTTGVGLQTFWDGFILFS